MKLQRSPSDLFDLAGETGLSTELLRLWQSHVGFPLPERTEQGEAYFPDWQVRRLKIIRRLIALGEPPARLHELDEEELAALLDYRSRVHDAPPAAPATTRIEDYIHMLASNAFDDVEAAMQGHVIEQGLEDFVLTVAAPLGVAVGRAWERGVLTIGQEHIFSDLLMRTLRACSSTLFQPVRLVQAKPLVLLCTPPGEVHVLGLAMVETLLLLQDCRPLHLGAGLPTDEIARTAQGVGADIVAISVSAAYHPGRAVEVLAELAATLPGPMEIWAGGGSSGLCQPLPARVRTFTALDAIAPAVEAWRRSHTPHLG